MLDRCFRMLICAPSGAGETNLYLYMIYRLLHYYKIFLSAKKLEQSKYQNHIKAFEPISDDAVYDVIKSSNDKIIPVSELADDNQNLIIFDDYISEKKNQRDIIDYFL